MIDVKNSHSQLRNDVKKLGNILGEILVHHGGLDLFNKVELIRETTKNYVKIIMRNYIIN